MTFSISANVAVNTLQSSVRQLKTASAARQSMDGGGVWKLSEDNKSISFQAVSSYAVKRQVLHLFLSPMA